MVDEAESKLRRWLILIIAIILLLVGGVGEIRSERLATSFSNMAFLRVGLLLLACWIAYPMLRKPVAWLPPGAVAVGVILLGAVAASPRLLPFLIPVFGALLALGAFVRYLRPKG